MLLNYKYSGEEGEVQGNILILPKKKKESIFKKCFDKCPIEQGASLLCKIIFFPLMLAFDLLMLACLLPLWIILPGIFWGVIVLVMYVTIQNKQDKEVSYILLLYNVAIILKVIHLRYKSKNWKGLFIMIIPHYRALYLINHLFSCTKMLFDRDESCHIDQWYDDQ